MSTGDRPGGVGSEGRREEASSLKPPNWTPPSPSSLPKHPSFLAFLRARARCPPLKCKELRPAPQAPMGAGIGLEINVAVPARPEKVGAAPQGGGHWVSLCPLSGFSTGGRPRGGIGLAGTWLPQPMCPAGQGVGSPRLW